MVQAVLPNATEAGNKSERKELSRHSLACDVVRHVASFNDCLIKASNELTKRCLHLAAPQDYFGCGWLGP